MSKEAEAEKLWEGSGQYVRERVEACRTAAETDDAKNDCTKPAKLKGFAEKALGKAIADDETPGKKTRTQRDAGASAALAASQGVVAADKDKADDAKLSKAEKLAYVNDAIEKGSGLSVDEPSFEGVTAFTKMKKDAVDSPIVAAAKAKRKVGGDSAKMPDSDVVKAFKKSGNEVGGTTADGTKIQELRRRAAKKALKDRLEACVEKGTAVKDCIAESDLKGTFKALLNEKHMNEVRRAAQDALGKQFTDCVEEKEAATENDDGRRRLAAHLGACASGLEDYQEKLKNMGMIPCRPLKKVKRPDGSRSSKIARNA